MTPVEMRLLHVNTLRETPRIYRRCGVIVLSLFLTHCASVDVIRLQPDILKTPQGTEPLAAIQVRTLGFYFMTLGMPDVNLDYTINDLLAKTARKLGADRLIELRFETTPSHGVWWMWKLLGFRSTSASAIALSSTDAEADREPQKHTRTTPSAPSENLPTTTEPTH